MQNQLFASAAVYGDPHIKTFDGMKIPFMSVGEFWLLRLFNFNQRSSGLGVQARMEAIVREWPEATWLTQIAIQYQDDQRQPQIIGVYVKNSKLQFLINRNEIKLQNFEHGATVSGASMVIDTNRTQCRIRLIHYSIIVDVKLGFHGSLMFRMSAIGNEIFKDGAFGGLFGNYNGNLEDDMSYGNGTSIVTWRLLPQSITETLSKIWAVENEYESFLYYQHGLNFFNFIFNNVNVKQHCDLSLVSDAAIHICKSSLPCLCDFLLTNGSIEAINKTLEAEGWMSSLNNDDELFAMGVVKLPSLQCVEPEMPNNGNGFLEIPFSSDKNVFKINYYCDRSFTMEGDRMSYCSNGYWTAHPPICRKSVQCDRNLLPRNAIVVAPNGFNVGSTIVIYCPDNMQMVSPNGIVINVSLGMKCIAENQWNSWMPSCILKPTTLTSSTTSTTTTSSTTTIPPTTKTTTTTTTTTLANHSTTTGFQSRRGSGSELTLAGNMLLISTCLIALISRTQGIITTRIIF